MTKRFENRLNKSNVKFNTLNPVWDNEKETGLNVFEMMDLLNKYDTEYNMCHNDVLRLEKENEQLKEIIKLSCVMEICESCKHGHYWISGDFFGKEGDFKCLKGHPADECCEIMDCKDYEMKDLKELLEWVKR